MSEKKEQATSTFVSEIFKYFGSAKQRQYENESKEKEVITEAAKAYREKVGMERYGDMCDIYVLIPDVSNYINSNDNLSKD